jgi:hypothetical protein
MISLIWFSAAAANNLPPGLGAVTGDSGQSLPAGLSTAGARLQRDPAGRRSRTENFVARERERRLEID